MNIPMPEKVVTIEKNLPNVAESVASMGDNAHTVGEAEVEGTMVLFGSNLGEKVQQLGLILSLFVPYHLVHPQLGSFKKWNRFKVV